MLGRPLHINKSQIRKFITETRKEKKKLKLDEEGNEEQDTNVDFAELCEEEDLTVLDEDLQDEEKAKGQGAGSSSKVSLDFHGCQWKYSNHSPTFGSLAD